MNLAICGLYQVISPNIVFLFHKTFLKVAFNSGGKLNYL